MIGRSCKRREALRRAVLIGRALLAMPPSGGGSRETRSEARSARYATSRVARREGPPEGPAAREGRPHPVPFRTRKLSAPSPRVLRCSPWEGRTQLGLPGAPTSFGARRYRVCLETWIHFQSHPIFVLSLTCASGCAQFAFSAAARELGSDHFGFFLSKRLAMPIPYFSSLG